MVVGGALGEVALSFRIDARQTPARKRGLAAVSAVLLCALAACSPRVDTATLSQDGDLLRRDAVIATPAAARLEVVERRTARIPAAIANRDAGGEFRVGPGDSLRINVFGEPGLTEVVARVDASGFIQLPIIELVNVKGLTTQAIQKRLKAAYEKEFSGPWVTVELADAKSRPIYLLGEFNQPGVRYLEQPTTLLEALALGGGLSEKAYLPGARLIRDGEVATVDLKGLLREGRLEQNVWVAPKDVIFAPRSDDMQIYVLGAVRQPRAIPFGDNGRSLLEALTLAQGPDMARAELGQVHVIRSFSATEGELLVADAAAILTGQSVDLPLAPGDVVFVPQSGVADFNDGLANIIPSLQVIGGVLTPIALVDAILND